MKGNAAIPAGLGCSGDSHHDNRPNVYPRCRAQKVYEQVKLETPWRVAVVWGGWLGLLATSVGGTGEFGPIGVAQLPLEARLRGIIDCSR